MALERHMAVAQRHKRALGPVGDEHGRAAILPDAALEGGEHVILSAIGVHLRRPIMLDAPVSLRRLEGHVRPVERLKILGNVEIKVRIDIGRAVRDIRIRAVEKIEPSLPVGEDKGIPHAQLVQAPGSRRIRRGREGNVS